MHITYAGFHMERGVAWMLPLYKLQWLLNIISQQENGSLTNYIPIIFVCF